MLESDGVSNISYVYWTKALKNILPEVQYENFILLHSAVTILCTSNLIQEYKNIDCAQEMLEKFVAGF